MTASRPYARHAQPFYPSRMVFHFHCKQNKEPMRDCVAALLLCLASKTRSPCKTALLLAALLLCLASKTSSPCKTVFCCFTIQSCLMTAALAKCVAASPGKQNKEPVQDCVLLRCCFAWQARKGARAFANCVALDGAIPSAIPSICPTDVRGL